MNYNFYTDFDPDEAVCGGYVELTENDLCWPQDVDIPSGSFYRYSSTDSWEFSANGTTASLYCSGDRIEVVKPGNPPRSIVYEIV